MQQRAIADLARSGISEADATKAGIFDVADASAIFPEFKPAAALVIPYFDIDGTPARIERGNEVIPFCRVRYLAELPSRGFAPQKMQRYAQPRNSGTRAYFAPHVDWAAIAADPSEPVVITEGEKKALAATLAGFPVIALGGVYNFMACGELLPELLQCVWRGREVYIAFDSDAAFNPHILAAEARLVDELQRKRGARCSLVRIPQDGDHKVGLDDLLLAEGPEGFVRLVTTATPLGTLDAKVIALNKSVAWVERENMVYDLEARMFIPKDSFVKGSRFSALKHITIGAKQRTEPKELSVAQTWLTHPHAQRFSEVLFRPGEGETVEGDGGRPALNLWTGWEPGEGDVAPFLALTEHLMRRLAPEHRDLALKLMAYKAQNPADKVPLALVLVGPQGCGKTMWAECIRDAFAPYGVDVTSKAFHSEFQGWLERSLIAVINEAEHEDMVRGADVLKSLISDLHRPMNEKYRPARQIKTYTMYILTSNSRAVAAFAPDDRRMIVVDCPPKREAEFYDRVLAWRRAGGAKALLGWLLNYDLNGWRPPPSAPMTAEKSMAYVESLSPVQRLADDMLSAPEHQVTTWLQRAAEHARFAELSPDAAEARRGRATLENLKIWPVRDWYTPEELLNMFPQVVAEMLNARLARTVTPGQISRELREAGIPYLRCTDDPRGFMWKGKRRQYLVVANFDDWSRGITQADFDRAMQNTTTFKVAGRL